MICAAAFLHHAVLSRAIVAILCDDALIRLIYNISIYFEPLVPDMLLSRFLLKQKRLYRTIHKNVKWIGRLCYHRTIMPLFHTYEFRQFSQARSLSIHQYTVAINARVNPCTAEDATNHRRTMVVALPPGY